MAPRAGAWQITARNASLVDVRRSCAAPAPICWRADGDAPAVVELSAGEAVHLVLTPPHGDALGAHILTVEPL